MKKQTSRITEKDKREMRELYAKGNSAERIAIHFNCSKSLVNNTVAGYRVRKLPLPKVNFKRLISSFNNKSLEKFETYDKLVTMSLAEKNELREIVTLLEYNGIYFNEARPFL